MKENNNPPKSLKEVIQLRRTIRSFTTETPRVEDIQEIIQSAIFAPYGGASGLPLNEIRKIFIFSQNTEPMERARGILRSQLKKKARTMNVLLILLPFLERKCSLFQISSMPSRKTEFPRYTELPILLLLLLKKSGFPQDIPR